MKKLILLVCALSGLLVSCSVEDYSFAKGEYYYDGYAMADAASEEMPGDQQGGDRFDEIVENDFIEAAKENTSTFSVDADGAAYAYMRRCIKEGSRPSANSVRIEEYLNYFTFDYPDPADGSGVALNAEVGPCAWNQDHKLLRLGIKGKTLEESQIPTANYVFLVDVSGSMSSDDKLPLLKKGLIAMLDHMSPNDRVAIVTYDSEEKLILKSTAVSSKQTIVNAIKKLDASGSTAGEKGMKMAYQEAEKNFIEGGNNRIIMGTDGDFNVGITSTEGICNFVKEYASKGIYITLCGFGRGNLNDAMMEKVSNSGNGTYEYIDCEKEMTKVFVNERSRFVSVANDCKAQVIFDNTVVKSYRLIGYENRLLRNEDFEDDKVDAAEIGSGQTITALYELELLPDAEGSVARFDFRYKDAIGDQSKYLTMDVPAVTDKLSENLGFASAIAAWGLHLRNSKYKGSATPDLARQLASGALGADPYGYRQEFLSLIETGAQLN